MNKYEILEHGKYHPEYKEPIFCPECGKELENFCCKQTSKKRWKIFTIFLIQYTADKFTCDDCGCVFIANKKSKIVDFDKGLLLLAILVLAAIISFVLIFVFMYAESTLGTIVSSIVLAISFILMYALMK